MTYDLDRLYADLETARIDYNYRGLMNCAIRPGFTAEDARRQSRKYDECGDRVRELEGAWEAARWGIPWTVTPQARHRIERTLDAYRETNS